MKETFIERAAKLLKDKKKQQRWIALVVVLASVVSIGTVAAMTNDAMAMTHKERVLQCHVDVHQHQDSCWTKVRDEDGGSHWELTCGLDDRVIHVHNDDCYDSNGYLVCSLRELRSHTHTADCYTVKQSLTCGREENPGHVHTDECWQTESVLTCDRPEHVHSGDCYELVLTCDEDHEHTEECFAEELTCDLEEHVHDESCYENVDTLVCGKEEGEGAHTHDSSCYEEVWTLVCQKEEAIPHTHSGACYGANGNLTCGKLQLEEHVHGSECFVEVELTAEEVAELNEAADAEAADEEPAGDQARTDIRMPAQSFSAQTDGLRVSVTADEGAFPEGTEMTVAPVYDEEVLSAAEDAVAGEVVAINAVEISFLDTEGEPVEPAMPICVTLASEAAASADETVVVSVENGGAAEVVEQSGEEMDEAPAEAEVTFETEIPVVYALVGTKLEKNVLASDGHNYKVSVTYTADSGIPEGADLEVQEIPGESEEYEEYVAKTENVLAAEEKVAFARFFDITIVKDGVELQPEKPVEVTIELADELNEDVKVLHFGAAMEEVAADVRETADGTTVDFEASGFSVYAVVGYTVDFYYGDYEYHLPGEGEILLSDLFGLLGIEKDAADAESVTFSAPELVAVEQVEGDWRLVSLQAFDTEETLTVAMKNGDAFTVRVTDAADVNTTVTVKIIGIGTVGAKSSGSWTYSFSDGQQIKRGTEVNNTTVASLRSGNTDIDYGYLRMQNSWTAEGGTGYEFVGYVVNNDTSIALNGGNSEKTAISANTLYNGANKKFSFVENTTITAIFKPSGSNFTYYGTDGNGTLSTGAEPEVAGIYYTYSTDDTGVTANPNGGYYFDYWEYNNGEKYYEKTFDPSLASMDGIVTAHFHQPYSVTYQVNNHDWGTINRRTGGVDYDWTGSTYYANADGYLSNSVSAKANEGYVFSHWELNDEKIDLPYDFTAGQLKYTENSILKAFFKPAGSWKLTYEAEEGGTVSITEDYATTQTYSALGVSAIPEENAVFMGWYEGDTLFSTKQMLAAADLMSDKFTGDTTLTAKYQAPVTIRYTTKQRDNTGAGTVSRNSESVKFGGQAVGATANASSGRFIWWEDSDGNVVSTNATFIPQYGQIKNTTYYAVFDNVAGIVLTVSDTSIAKVSGNNRAVATLNDSMRVNPSNDTTYYLWSDENNRLTAVNFVYWEEVKLNGEITYCYDLNYRVLVDSKSEYSVIKAVVKPSNTFIVNYACTTGGAIDNTTDYAGSETAKGVTATANIGNGYYFLGWYIGERRVSTSETVSADDLITWKNSGYITADNTVITARFGTGYVITYNSQVDDEVPELLDSERITVNSPTNHKAEEKDGANFLGWYIGDTLLTANDTLTGAMLSSVTTDTTVTAKYSSARVATYAVEHLKAAKDGVSTYGQIVANGTTTTTSTTQNANSVNILTGSATAIPARGCEFVQWVVTDGSGEAVSIDGFDAGSATIPGSLEIPSNVTFTAQFKKQTGAMEVIYTIQQENTDKNYGAKLTVGGNSVSGTSTENAYIAEVVPAGQSALGCEATGLTNLQAADTHYYNYRIMGWVLGDNNDENKDKLFTMSSTFIPTGEYLQDVNGTGVRYFRVVAKRTSNIYILFKVSIPSAGSFSHGGKSGDFTDTLFFVNNETQHKTQTVIFGNTPEGIAYYNVYTNTNYKLVGFTYNGVDIDLVTPITDTSTNLIKGKFAIDSDKYGYGDLFDYIENNSSVYLEEGITSVDTHVNILIARYEISGYNIEYHVKSGAGGTLSNYGDSYTSAEKDDNQKTDGMALIMGSTAIADAGDDYVFVRWEDAEGKEISTDPYYAPDKDTDITSTDITYHYYAVFEKALKVNIEYEPENPDYGVTIPAAETVYQGATPVGSTATAFDGWVFDYWTRDGVESSAKLSADEFYRPVLTDDDFAEETKTIKFIAHFKRAIDTSITVKKIVEVTEGLDLANVNTTIYLALTKDGVDVTDKNGNLLIEEIVVKNGIAQNDAVFSGLAYNDTSAATDKYEVWEMHKVGSTYVRQYTGMLAGDDYQLTKISAANDSTETGNNAILTEADPHRTVTFTNTYSKETATVTFEVRKEWQDSKGTMLTADRIPEGATVEITVYSEVNGETKAVKSVWLDGVVDKNGEEDAWRATFSNLPKYASDGTTEVTYKVRETTLWEGYKPYINSGSTYLSENLYLYNSGGKIVNKAEEANTVLITVQKVDKANEATLLAGATFYLTKKNASNVYELYNDGAHSDGMYTVGGVGDGLGLFTVALPDGEYQLTEKASPAGYIIMSGALSFKIENGELSSGEGNDEDFLTIDGDAGMITIKNQAGVALPMTGGRGTNLFYVLGGLFTTLGGAMLLARRRKETE